MSRRSGHLLVLVVWSALLLVIGINSDWHAVHDDNGVMQTTHALSHLRYGLERTVAHNWFVPKDGSEWIPYPHHPPAVPLLLAGTFAVTGSEAPAVARTVMIVFSIGNVIAAYALLSILFARPSIAFIGAFFFATVPMQSFFGRMVNYEPPTLFFVLLMLAGYFRYRQSRSPRALALTAGALIAGVMFDWPPLFFCAAIVISEAVEWVRGRSTVWPMLIIGGAGALGLVLALVHIVVAFGSLEGLVAVIRRDAGVGHDPLIVSHFIGLMIENYRHYFTASGLIAAIFAAVAAFAPHTRVGRALIGDRPDLRRFLLMTGAVALVYVVITPNRARMHHYWQFYFLPYAAVAFALAFEWLRARRANIIIALIVIEVAVATGYKLYRRHTEPGEYAVVAIRELQRLYLTPR